MAAFLDTGRLAAQTYIVQDGEAGAEIIIAEGSPRMVVMAALELQYYLERISGARLPVDYEPGTSSAVKIFVGRSSCTDSLGVIGEGLRYGAFRMVSGADWLVLLGYDYDFTPSEPWARYHSDRSRARAAWDSLTLDLTGSMWGHPFGSTFKNWWNPKDYDSFMSDRYGSDNRDIWDPNDLEYSKEYQGSGAGSGFWVQDDAGSLNAVYEFLRSLGARWYMPGPLGEIIPERESISLPVLDSTVYPDFDIRSYTWPNYSLFSFEDIIWGRRTGINSAYEVLGSTGYAHGLAAVHTRSKMKREHPEYYALIDGKRDTTHRGHGTACFTSEGLVEETIKYARFMFDHYDRPHVSIWPVDGYKHCECDSCKDKSPSELVWGFVDRVARALHGSHPGRLVSCGAYAQYKPAPANIDEFTPNVMVIISNERRPAFHDPERWSTYWERVESWQEKIAPGRLMRVENNLYSTKWGDWGRDENGDMVPIGFPVIHPHAMEKDLKALKGISLGECSEESFRHGRMWHAPGIDHVTLYAQSRLFWDVDQEVDSILNEYYHLFYGPAGDKMKAAFEYSEANYAYAENNFWCFTPGPWQRSYCEDPMDHSVLIPLLEMLQEARDTAGETIYGQRIQAVMSVLPRLDELRTEKVTVQVVNRDTGEPVEHATIYHDGISNSTGFIGSVDIHLPKGEWRYTIKHDNYLTLTDTAVISGDTSLVIPLTRQNHTSFHVVDQATREPVYRAVIYYGADNMKVTDATGETSISFQEGKLVYTVEHNDYFPSSDSAVISGDTILVVPLTRKLANIHFEVSDSAGPVQGAGISLNGWEIRTDSKGYAWFTDQQARRNYGYTIQLSGYQTMNDSLYLEIDTTLAITLKMATGRHDHEFEGIAVFPNPAGEQFYVSVGVENGRLILHSPEGKILIQKRIERGLNLVDVSKLHPGLYFLSIQSNNRNVHRMVVLE